MQSSQSDNGFRLMTRNSTGKTGGWDSKLVQQAPKGVPVVTWGELDLSSRIYDTTGVCVRA